MYEKGSIPVADAILRNHEAVMRDSHFTGKDDPAGKDHLTACRKRNMRNAIGGSYRIKSGLHKRIVAVDRIIRLIGKTNGACISFRFRSERPAGKSSYGINPVPFPDNRTCLSSIRRTCIRTGNKRQKRCCEDNMA